MNVQTHSEMEAVIQKTTNQFMFHIQVFRYVENLSGISCVKFNRCLNCNVLIPLHCSRSNYCYCPYFSDLCAFLYCAEVDWAMCLCRGSISADAEICDKRIHLVNFNSDLYARIHLKLCIAVPKDPFLQERFFLEICICVRFIFRFQTDALRRFYKNYLVK